MTTYNAQYKPRYDSYSVVTSYRNNGRYNDALYAPMVNNRGTIYTNGQNRFNQNQNFDAPFGASYQPNLPIFSNLPSPQSHNSLLGSSRTVLSV